MANRSSVTSGFAALAPPWVLSTLDGFINSFTGTFNDSSLGFVNTGTDTGSANIYTIPTLAFGTFSGYNQGSTFVLIPANTNTGASTLTIGLLGTAPIVDMFGGALTAGALLAGAVYPMVYTGTSFRLLRSTTRVTYTASNTPVNGTFNVITGWSVSSGTANIVSLASNIFTLKANCIMVLNGTASNGNPISIGNTNATGVVGAAAWSGSATAPSGTSFLQSLTFYGTGASTFQMTAEGNSPSPPTLTLFLTFIAI